jgi:dTDP-4-dehydrorhamnose 3,5-epimerase
MTQIDGVRVTPLRRLADERGAVFHMLRVDSEVFESFGEIYFSMVYPGVVKGWHKHREMTLNYAVPVGMIKLVCYDDRPGSSTHGSVAEIFTGELDYALITIEPGIWNGFKGIGDKPSLVANCATVPHSPNEIERLDPFSPDIPYDWSLRHG